jgi:ectoine hydroxylase-related dioxygenase (phytanoyl-CoA dioxygenase family)
MNCMWCLSDIYKENGATMYIPGSNKWTTRSEVPANAPEMLVPFEAKKGSIICMDARVWHTSGENVTKDVDRPLLFGYYTQPFLRQQVNWTAKLPQSIKDEVSDDLYQWLGLGPAANVGRTGDLRFMHVVSILLAMNTPCRSKMLIVSKQYPNGVRADEPEKDSKGGALAGYYDDRTKATSGERGFVG